MKILYIHQYFKTPSEPGGTRSYWIAKELIANGYDVIMISGVTGSANERVFEKNIDGIKVIYIREDYDQSMGILQRLKAFVKFMFKATKVALAQKNVDLAIATSTPLTVGIPVLILKWFKKIPYVFEVRDLWPEVPIQMGAIKNTFMIRLSRLFEKTIYKGANHVIALSPGMQEGVVKYIAKTKTSMIPNMSKVDEFWPRPKNTEFMKSLGLTERTFKVIHFGSLGLANGAHTILESAKLLEDDTTIEFLFVGGGSQELELEKIRDDYKLNNVKFLGRFPMLQISEIVNFCDVSIVSFSDIPILYTNSPNKLFDSLSAGKPVIVNSAGWTKNLVEKYNCGFYVNPNKPAELAEKLIYLTKHPELIETMGNESRKLALEKFDKSILCKEFVNVISKYNV